MSRTIRYNLLFLGIAVTAGIVYGFTLAPSVVHIDSGELAAVQSTLGIAHPTGYPLFTILGYLFLQIPLFPSNIAQLNFLSLIYCVAGLFFWVKSLRLILTHYSQIPKAAERKKRPRSRKKASHPSSEEPAPLYADLTALITGGLFLGFSRTYWSQSSSVEVYSLHVLLIVLVVYFLLRAYLYPQQDIKPWIWVAVALSLSFSNHMTSLLILPGVAFLFFKKMGIRRQTVKPVLIMTGLFVVLIALLYLYLPLRASQNPVLNWGNPENWKNLIRHVSGKQYSVWLFSSADSAWKNFSRFIDAFPGEFTWAGLILGILGVLQTLKKWTGLSIFLFISFFCTVLYAINYDIHDLETYFLLAYLVFAFWIAIGIRWCLVRIRIKKWIFIVIPALFFCIVYESVSHYSENDQSNLTIYEEYTKQALASIPTGAVLLSYQWDYLISPAYYFQFIEGYRRDVAIVDKELLRRSWYFDQMESNYPDVMKTVTQEVYQFLTALKPFEEGGNFNANLLEQRYRGLIARLIETSKETREVYIGPELIQNEFRQQQLYLPEGYRVIPDLFFFRVVKSEDYSPLMPSDIELRFPEKGDAYTNSIGKFVSNMLIWRTLYEMQHGKVREARHIRSLFLKHFSLSRLPKQIRDL